MDITDTTKTKVSSFLAILENPPPEQGLLVVDLADKTGFVTPCEKASIQEILQKNLTLLIDAKANLTKWNIDPHPNLRVICLATIKKLIAKHHNETVNLPTFKTMQDALGWLTHAANEAFDRINKLKMADLATLECRVILPTIAIERKGMPFQKAPWQEHLTRLEAEIKLLQQRLGEILPSDNGFLLFGQDPVDLNNPNAVKQALEKILGQKLDGTSQSSLKDFDHEAVRLVLRYREHARMISNYGENFLNKIENNRLRGHFTPISCASGRFACHDINLLALPNDADFQACIAPPKHYVITHFDYGAFELRILAALSGDETLIRIFNDGEDIHGKVAQEIFGVTVSKDENSHLRNQAKVLNFGLIYGMGEAALSKQLKISKHEASSLLHNYFKRFSRVGEFLSSLENMAKNNGYVTTVLGRRAYFTDYEDTGLVARLARNIPIQGTGADIVKLALCRVFKRLAEQGLDAHVINVVHDEIVIEAHKDVQDDLSSLVVQEMREAFSTLCPAVPPDISIS